MRHVSWEYQHHDEARVLGVSIAKHISNPDVAPCWFIKFALLANIAVAPERAYKPNGGVNFFLLDMRRVLGGTPRTNGAGIRQQNTSHLQNLRRFEKEGGPWHRSGGCVRRGLCSR